MQSSRKNAARLLALFVGFSLRASAQECLWLNETPLPGESIGNLVVFDSGRAVSTFVAVDGLWSWDGSLWSFVSADYPLVGGEVSVAFDNARQVIVLHRNGQTWESAGGEWMLRSTNGPASRSGFRIVYDSARQVTVLHGGRNSSGNLNDTWEWDGVSWTLRSTTGPFRRYYSAAYDSLRQRVVIFGGRDSSSQPQRNLWEWDGTSWILLADQVGPSTEREEMVYDASRNVLVLAHAEGYWQEIWEWDGKSFQNVPHQGPRNRQFAGLVYDAARQTTILYGGQNRRDHWEWNGASWHLVGGLTPFSTYFFYNRDAAQLQGVSLCCGISQLWSYDGPDWSVQQANGPPYRFEYAVAYDESRGVVVLFGGRDISTNPHTQFDDTWEWNGTTWSQIIAPGPSARSGHRMVYDSARGMVVLFGGYVTDPSGWNWVEFDETWGWDGSAWTLLSDSGPSPRYWHAMTYDRVRQTTLLFGGAFYTGIGGPGYGDLWEWNGTVWTLLSNSGQNKPGTGYNYSFVYDEARDVNVLVSGGWSTDVGGVAYTKTWEWNGSNWLQTIASGSPRGPAVYDVQRQQTILVDGPDTWVYPFVAAPASPPVAETVQGGTGTLPAIKNRYLSFSVPDLPVGSLSFAFRITAVQLPGPSDCPNVPDFSDRFPSAMWVGDEVLQGASPTGLYKLSATPVFRDWSAVPGGLIHVSDCNIIPCATYAVEAVSDTPCNVGQPAVFSEPTLIATSSVWADIVANNGSPLPDGVVDFVDISASVDRFRNIPTSPPGTWCDLGGDSPYQGVNFNIDFTDISLVVDAFRGRPYPFPGPTAPAQCP